MTIKLPAFTWRKLCKSFAVVLAAGLTGKNALATSATALTAAATASQLGRDPIPWLIGAAAVTVVYAYKKPTTREHALANAVISVFLGGIGAPYVATILSRYIDPVFANDWILAGVLGAGWPWLVPIALGVVQRRADKMGEGRG
jgi:hypothetical protein